MLLAVDVGNSNITLGVFRGAELVVRWRLDTKREASSDELGPQIRALFAHAGFDRKDVRGVVVAAIEKIGVEQSRHAKGMEQRGFAVRSNFQSR
jgi:pantothenate kinase type III